ncbi:hypothetical protein Tco_0491630 [Tanacetum coccineum]
MEPDISNMTLNEYLMYQGRHRDLERSYTSRKSVAPVRNRILVYSNSDEEDEGYCSLHPLLLCFQTPQPCATFNSVHHNSNMEVDIDNMTLEEYARYEEDSNLDEILDDLFRIGAENLRKMEHEVPHTCDDKTVDITDYEDSDHKDGELHDLPIFSASLMSLLEVPIEDDEMDDDVDHSNTNEALQWSLAKDPFLVCIELKEQSSFVLHTILSSISNEKSTQALARGVVIRETPERPVSKKKEKVDVARGKGIELLSDVALTEEAHEAESWGNDEDDINNDQDSRSEGSDQDKDSDDDKTQSDSEDESDFEHETDENESESESDQDVNEEDKDDEEEVKEELVKTPSNDSNDEDETKIADKTEGEEDEEMDYTTKELKIPVSSSLIHSTRQLILKFSNIPLQKLKCFFSMDVVPSIRSSTQENPITPYLPFLVISESSPVFSTISAHSLQSFTPPPLLSTPTPPPTTEATNPPSTLPDFASVFQFNNRVTTLEQEVAELKKDPLHTQVTALVDEHLDAKLGATRDEFMNFLSKSLTARITKQVNDQLPQLLPEVVSNFPPPVIQKKVTESLEEASSQGVFSTTIFI